MATIVLFYREDKILLSLRAGNIERTGTWGCIGGHVNLEEAEGFAEALSREIQEETGLYISPEKFNETSPFKTVLLHHIEMIETSDASGVHLQYIYPLSKEEEKQMTPEDETDELKWFTRQEFEKLAAEGKMGFEEHSELIRTFFKQAQI